MTNNVSNNRINIVDIESTCWNNSKEQGKQPNEIIEIGIAVLDLEDMEILDSESIIVKPAFSRVSRFCTELTTLTQEDVDKGYSFQDALSILRNDRFKSNKTYWGSWGDYDRNQFQRNCKLYDAKYPFGSRHANIKMIHAMMFGLEREVGLDRAVEMAGLEFEGTHHRGVDDAKMIAKVYADMLRQFRTGNVESAISM